MGPRCEYYSGTTISYSADSAACIHIVYGYGTYSPLAVYGEEKGRRVVKYEYERSR